MVKEWMRIEIVDFYLINLSEGFLTGRVNA